MYSVALISTLPTDWHRAMRTVVDGIREGVRNGCEEGANEARTTHKYKDRTGALTASIDGSKVDSVPLGAEGEIVAKEKYASFVEDGTAPHIITPSAYWTAKGVVSSVTGRVRKDVKPGVGRGHALRWVDEGGQHFARVVHHPGAPPMPFMGPAYTKAERVLVRDIEAYVVRAQSALEHA